jgi:alpha-L-fucosidase
LSTPLRAEDANLASYGVASASSEEKSRGNLIKHAHDGDPNTRWCSNGMFSGSWWALDLQDSVTISSVRILWEQPAAPYSYKIEGSADGKTWTTLAEGESMGETKVSFTARARHVRITHRNPTIKVWSSIREVEVRGRP